MKLADKVTLSGVSRDNLTREGYLDVRVRISRAGVYEYAAYELSPLFDDREPMALVRVYRPADEVFKAESMATFARKPVTIGHPWTGVNAENVKDHQVGLSSETVTREGDFLCSRLLIQSADAVNRVLRGEDEVSAGYECDVTRESGVYDQVMYDAVQRNIEGNHIALVDAGRCGPLCRVGDRAPSGAKPPEKASMADCGCSKETPPMTTQAAVAAAVALQAVTHDGFTGQMDLTAAAMFARLRDNEAATKTALSKLEGEFAVVKQAAADAATKAAADLEAARKLIPDAAALDKMVSGRVSLIANAKAVMGDAFSADGKTDADIRKAVVTAKLGDAAVAGKDETFITVAFDAVMALAGNGATMSTGDSIVAAAQQQRQQPANQGDAGKAHAAMMDRMRKASQPTTA